MPDSNSKPLDTYRVRFKLGGVRHLVEERTKAVSVDAAYDWAEEYLSRLKVQGEVYDIGQII
jgi:hypothetical protein